MGEPLGPARVLLLEYLPEVVGLFGFGRIVRERLVSFLQLRVVDLGGGDNKGLLLLLVISTVTVTLLVFKYDFHRILKLALRLEF